MRNSSKRFELPIEFLQQHLSSKSYVHLDCWWFGVVAEDLWRSGFKTAQAAILKQLISRTEADVTAVADSGCPPASSDPARHSSTFWSDIFHRYTSLHSERECLRDFACVSLGDAFEQFGESEGWIFVACLPILKKGLKLQPYLTKGDIPTGRKEPISPTNLYKFGMALPQVIFRITIFFYAVLCSTLAHSDAQTEGENAMPQDKVETIVCIRHGEKPLLGLGQLTCKGLNRALALPQVLLAKFGRPSFIFAPDPNQVAHDLGGEFCYVRPLATIEPAAIEYGLPVNTHFGFRDITGLQQELTKPIYESATIFVAWEHIYLDDFVRALVKSFGGDVSHIPGWQWNDYDSIFVVRITHGERKTTATFSRDAEGLNNLGSDCPKPRAP